MDNTKKVVRQQADVSQGEKLIKELERLIEDSIESSHFLINNVTKEILLMKLNSYIHRRDNKMFNQGFKTAEKEMGERK